ncbi:MAG: hypothetical protein OCD76_15045 [Reichenbachiella sp.]
MKATVIAFVLGIASSSVWAQEYNGDGEIEDTEIVIEKDRQIELNKEVKLYEFIKWKPETKEFKPEEVDNKTSFQYELTEEKKVYKPASNTVTEEEEVYLQYLKAGMGNYASPLVDLNLVTPTDANQVLSFNFKHLSFNKGEVDGENSASSTNLLALKGTKIWDKVKTTADLGFRSDLNYYYGYPEGSVVNRESIKKANKFFNAKLSIEDNNLDDDWNYELVGEYKWFGDNLQNQENTLVIDGLTAYQGRFFIDGQFYMSDLNSVVNARTAYRVMPYYSFEFKGVSLHGGVSFSGQNDQLGSISNFKVFPYISASYDLTEDYQVFGVLDAGYDFNTMYDFSDYVPYLNGTNTISNSENLVDISAGLRGNITESWYSELKFGYKSVRQLPIFLNDVTDQSLINIKYDNGEKNIFSIGVTSQYYLNKKNDFIMSLTYNSYSGGEYPYAYHLPILDLSVRGDHELYEKFTLQWQYQLLTGIKAYDSINVEDVDLDAIHKLDLSFHYQIKERLGAFISGENLIGQTYSRYLYYPQRSIQFKAGITYRF